jgi:hypothetical protein
MARAVYNGYQGITAETIKAIAADEATATCYGEDGVAHVWGSGKVYFLMGAAPIERIQPGRTLDWYADGLAVKVYGINGSKRNAFFRLSTWQGEGGEDESWWVNGYWENQPFFGRTTSTQESDAQDEKP